LKFSFLNVRNIFLFCYLAVSIGIVFLTTKQTYGVNDDVLIQSILSGTYTGKPEFILAGPATPKILFGIFVSSLYKLAPFINWFTILMLTFVGIAWFLLGQIVLRKFNFFNLGFYLIVSFIYLFWFIPSPTYTASSIILSIATFSKIFIENKLSTFQIIIYSVLISMSFLMRPESFVFGFIVVFGLFLFNLYKRPQNIIKNILILFGTILTVVLFNYTLEKVFIDSNAQWTNYSKFESARYKIQANDIELEVKSNPEKYNWSISETILFNEYLTVDKKSFNVSRYDKLINDYKLNFQKRFNLFNFFIDGHKKLINSDINWAWFDLAKLIPLSFVFFFFLCWPRILEFLIFYLISSFILYLSLLYVAFYLRQPERVQVSGIFAGILLPFLIYNLDRISKIRLMESYQTFILSIILLIIVFNGAKQVKYFDQKYNGMENIWITQSKFYESFPSDSIFIGNASQFRNNWQNPYLNDFKEIERRFFSLGWHNYSPLWLQRAENLNLTGNNLINSSISKPNVYWVSDEVTFNSLINFLDENRFKYSKFEKVKSIFLANNDYIVWKIS